VESCRVASSRCCGHFHLRSLQGYQAKAPLTRDGTPNLEHRATYARSIGGARSTVSRPGMSSFHFSKRSKQIKVNAPQLRNGRVTVSSCSWNARPSQTHCSEWRIDRGTWSAVAIALLLSIAGSAMADPRDTAAPSGTRQANRPDFKAVESPPQITIQANVFDKRVRAFISKVSGVPVWSNDDPVALWHTPICPLVEGLRRQDGEFVFDRLTYALASLGIPRGAIGCRPNFYVVATTQPEAVLKAWSHHDTLMFGDAAGSERFIQTPRPVRIWYNSALVGSDGNGAVPLSTFGGGTLGGFDGAPTFTGHGGSWRFEFPVVPNLLSVIAVIDLTQVMGLDWRQVTDYVVMAGLTKVDLDAKLGGAPTILRLFTSSADARPQGLSDWDRAFLTELYRTSQVSRHQRLEVAKAMLRDITLPMNERR